MGNRFYWLYYRLRNIFLNNYRKLLKLQQIVRNLDILDAGILELKPIFNFVYFVPFCGYIKTKNEIIKGEISE